MGPRCRLGAGMNIEISFLPSSPPPAPILSGSSRLRACVCTTYLVVPECIQLWDGDGVSATSERMGGSGE